MSIANVTAAATSANNIDGLTTFFSAKSGSNISPTFLVNKEPWYIEAFNLAGGDTVTVQQVAGPGSGTFFQNYAPAGAPLQLTQSQTKVRIDWPGMYRLVFAGTSVVATYVVGFPGTMTQESSTVYSVTAGATNPVDVNGIAPIIVTGIGTVGDPYEVSIAGLGGTPGTPPDGGTSVFIGNQAGINSTGSENVFIGDNAGGSCTGSDDVYMGINAGQTSSGDDNVFLGQSAGASTSMSTSVCIGKSAGLASTSNRAVFIGPFSGFSETNQNVIIIGTETAALHATADNQCILGGASITQLRTAGSVIAGGAISASDSRLKKSLSPLRDALRTVDALDLIEFSWDQFRLDDAGLPYLASEVNKRHTGVIAQDIEKILPNVIHEVEGKDGELYKYVRYDHLIPYLLAAVQELSAKLNALESKNGSGN